MQCQRFSPTIDLWPIGLLARMNSFADLTDALILLIPEDGRRISNDQIKDALEQEAGEPISDQMLKEIKKRVLQVGAAETAKGPGGGLKAVGQKLSSGTNNSRSQPANASSKDKSLESWIWDAACSIRGAQDAPKYKSFILPLIFTKRLCDVFDDELNRIAKDIGSRKKAFQLAKADHKLVRFYLPLMPDDPEKPVWSVIRELSDQIGEGVTTHMREIAKFNPRLKGIIDRVDFNATVHGQRELNDDRLSNLIEAISTKRLGLEDVEADIIGSYEYLIRNTLGKRQVLASSTRHPKWAPSCRACSNPSPGCPSRPVLRLRRFAGEAGDRHGRAHRGRTASSTRLYGQEYVADTWAMACMNMIIHDMEEIEIGDTFENPKFRKGGKLRTFDRVVANPMNQIGFRADYMPTNRGRRAGFPGKSSAGWGWSSTCMTSMTKAELPSCLTPVLPLAAQVTPASTRKKKFGSGSSTKTTSKASSIFPRISFTTQTPPASSYSSTRISPRLGRGRFSSSTPARSSKRAIPRTSSLRPASSTSPTP